jgi:antirestriction protein ArdC
LSRLNVPIIHGGSRAYYGPTMDAIQVPPREAFRSTEAYYSVLAHEGIHASGHPSRLDRKHKYKILEERAGDELIAEIGSVFVCAQLDISP